MASFSTLRHPDCENKKKCADIVPDDLAGILEHELSRCGNVVKCAVKFSEPQTQLLYRDVRRWREKIVIDQIKPVRVLDNPVKEKFFKKMVE